MTATRIADAYSETFVVVFDIGEEVTEGLLRFSRDQGLDAAHLTAIGAFSDVTLGFFELEKRDYRRNRIDEQVELVSLVGNIARGDDGEPKLHAHAVVGKFDGTAFGGHLLEAHVKPTLEVVVTESPHGLRRRVREDLGLALLDLSSA